MKLLIFTFVITLISTDKSNLFTPFPNNENVKFQIYTITQNVNGFLIRGKNIVEVELNSNQISDNQIDSLMFLLDSSEFDFSANLILYSYFKRDASFFLGLTTSSSFSKNEIIELWRKNKKEEDLNYWEKLKRKNHD